MVWLTLMTNTFSNVAQEILRLIPQGGSIGNGKARSAFSFPVTVEQYNAGKQELLDAGVVVQGRGRGGSLRRAGEAVVAAATVVDASTSNEGGEESPADVPAPEVSTSGAGDNAIPSVSASGSDEVVRPIATKPYVNMGAWMTEVLTVLGEFGCTYPNEADLRDKIARNALNTDLMMAFHSEANDLLIAKAGVWIHFNKGVVRN